MLYKPRLWYSTGMSINRLTVGIFATVLTVLMTVAPVSARVLELSPPRTELQLEAGQQKTGTIMLRNVTSEPLAAQVRFADFKPDSANPGGITLLESGISDTTYGLSAHLSGPPTVTIPAQATVKYTYTVTGPLTDMPRSYYGVVRFIPGGGDPNAVSLSPSVAGIVIATVGRPAITARIKSLSVSSRPQIGQSGKTVLHLEIENSGFGAIKPDSTIRVTTGSGRTVTTLKAGPEGSVLPESSRIYTAEWTDKIDADETYYAAATTSIYGHKTLTSDKVLISRPDTPAASTGSTSGTTAANSTSSSNVAVTAGITTMLALLVASAAFAAYRWFKRLRTVPVAPSEYHTLPTPPQTTYTPQPYHDDPPTKGPSA